MLFLPSVLAVSQGIVGIYTSIINNHIDTIKLSANFKFAINKNIFKKNYQ